MNNSIDTNRRSAEFGASEAARLYAKNPAQANISKTAENQPEQVSGIQKNHRAVDKIELTKEATAGAAALAPTQVRFENWKMSSASQTESQSQKQVASVERASPLQRPEPPREVRGSDVNGAFGALNGPESTDMTISQSNEAQVVRKTDDVRKSTGFTVTPEQAVVTTS